LSKAEFQEGAIPASDLPGRKALVVCNGPEHLSAVRYKMALERHDVATSLQPMSELLHEVRHVDGRTLREIASVDPYALHLDVRDVHFIPEAVMLQDVSFVILVTNDFGPYASLIAELVESIGISQLNSAHGLGTANDKWRTHVALRATGVPMVKGLLVHSVEEAIDAARELEFPLVVKELRGTQGNGVRLASCESDLLAHCTDLRIDLQPLLVEHYIECSASDKRILMMDGTFVAAMERHAKSGDFRANISLGGTAEHCYVTDVEVEVTRQAAAATGLRLIGADIATVTKVLPGREYLPEGTAFCIEANAMPALADLAQIAHLDCARTVIDMLFVD
jgi:RimK family alpha-L-glutamate ligase